MINFLHRQAFAILAFLLLVTPTLSLGQLRAQTLPATGQRDSADAGDGTEGVVPPTLTRAGGRAGIAAYPDGKWALTGLIVGNPSDKPAEVEAIAYFRSFPDQQYKIQLWIPPNATRRATIPMYVPRLAPGNTRRETVVIVRDLATGKFLRNSIGRKESTLPLSKPPDPFVSAVIFDSLIVAGPETLPTDGDAAQALRVGMRKRVYLANMATMDFPQFFLAFDALKQVVISNDALQHDGGAAAALREWLRLGGQVWIMLDRVQEATVAAVWNGNLPFEIVDNVTLTDFELSSYDSANQSQSRRHIDVEDPIAFARVIVDADIEVTHWVGEWPASFIVPVGHGHVVVTTLGIPAWIMPGYQWRGSKPRVEPRYYPQEELIALGEGLQVRLRESAASRADFQAYLSERVGYEVVRWQVVAVVLLLFVVSLLVVGLVLLRLRRLGYMLGFAPAAAATATVVLLVIGGSSNRFVPKTVGAVQWIKVFTASREAVVEGELAFYHPKRTKLKAGAEGGMFTLDMSGQAGVKRTMKWSGRSRWEWDGLTVPAGLRFAAWRRPIHYDKPPIAHVEFGDLQMVGQLRHSPWENLEDAILLFPNRRPVSVNIESNGALTIAADVPMGRGQFVQGTLLSDEQGRRQRLLAQIYARRHASGFPMRPTLLAWSDVPPKGLIFDEDARQFYTSLISIPIEFHRPEPGSSVKVGSSFLRMSMARSPFGDGVSPVYRVASDEWVELAVRANAWVRFQLPPELLPFTVDTATVVVELNVPSRTVNFRSVYRGRAVELGEESSPSGAFSFTLKSGVDFELDEQGGILFNIQISDVETADERKPKWKVDDVRMSIIGRVPETEDLSAE
jgi:hypothetical protein